MDIPFTAEQFLDVFETYNEAIWPAQIVAYIFGGTAVALAIWRRHFTYRVNAVILTLFWLWMGGLYHLEFFSAINPAAWMFGFLFLLQGIFFLAFGVVRPNLRFRYRSDAYGLVGGLLILYSMVLYPLLGWLFGHAYPFAPMFGVAPCPTTIFTFGLLLWTTDRVPGWLLIIPAAWSVLGFTAALRLGVVEDFGLLVAGAVAVPLLLYRNRRPAAVPAMS